MLRNRVVRTSAYNHWLDGKLPEALDPAHLPHVLEGIRQGNRESVNRLIEGHMRLAADIVGRYRTVAMHANTDEMVSAAFEGVVHAVNNIVEGKLSHDNVTAYITSHIHNYVQRRGIDPYVQREGQCRLKQELATQDSRSLEATEEVELALKDETDTVIVEMLSQGYTQVEIAAHLGITQPAIGQRLRKIRSRLLERKHVVE